MEYSPVGGKVCPHTPGLPEEPKNLALPLGLGPQQEPATLGIADQIEKISTSKLPIILDFRFSIQSFLFNFYNFNCFLVFFLSFIILLDPPYGQCRNLINKRIKIIGFTIRFLVKIS